MPKKVSLEIQKRVKKLRRVIEHHRYLYHVENREEISSEALDSLKDELKKIEEEYPSLVTPESPTQRVAGEALDKFEKVKHKVRQWSLGDAFSRGDLENFEKKIKNFLKKKKFLREKEIEYFCELKIDGLKIILEYEKGILKRASTRGDGQVGEDVTLNVKTIESIPLSTASPINGIFEGEIFISKENFKKLNQRRKREGKSLFANPRNLAAGSLRQLDPAIVEKRKLDSFIYAMTPLGKDFKNPPQSQKEEMEFLKKLAFKTNREYFLAKSIDEVFSFYRKIEKKKEKLDYFIDGIVLKVNQKKIQKILGHTGKAPRFSIALKFPAEQKTTVVEEINLQVGRTGIITPVAVLRPISIAGSTISRATLHNQDEIERMDLRVGDTVIVEKAGEIIPKVVSVLREMRPPKARAFIFPKTLSACGGDGSIEKIPGQVAYRCKKVNSTEILLRKISYFISKKAFDFSGIGPKNIEQFIEAKLVSEPSDLFTLQFGDLEILEGWGEKSAKNLMNEIERKRKISLGRFIISLGIPEVGEETALLLGEYFRKFPSFQQAKLEELEKIHGVGTVVAGKITEYFKDAETKKMLRRLLKQITVLEFGKTKLKKSFLNGKKVVLTGTLENYSREEAKAIIRKSGGKISSSVSSGTHFLLLGKQAGSKLTQARHLGITILEEKDLESLQRFLA